jgi:hypothetical protein
VSLARYRDLGLPRNDIPDLIIRMGMLMDPGTGFNGVTGERHVLRMEETALPAFPRLLYAELA